MLAHRMILGLACLLSATTAFAQTSPEANTPSATAPAVSAETRNADDARAPAATTPAEPKAEVKAPDAPAATTPAEPKAEAKTPDAPAATTPAEPKAEVKAPDAPAVTKPAEPKAEAKAPDAPAATTPAEPKAEAKTPDAPAATTPAEPKAEAKAPDAPKPDKPKLAVMTGGGAFAQAYRRTVLDPFAQESGVTISDASADATSGDILLLDALELHRGCTAGKLMALELAELVPASSKTSSGDFLEGALKPCGIAPLAWSNLFVYDPAKFAKRAPRAIADVLDTRRYPGKRALPKDGRGLAEALLVADGVAPADVYRVLDTSDGISRILKALKKDLGAEIVWYDTLHEAIALVRSGQASIAFTSNGHAFTEQARGGPLGLIWDGQVLHAAYLAITKETREADHAKALVAFASRPEQLALLVRQIPYGPMRHAGIAVAQSVRHVVTGQELGPFLPTAPDNMRTAVRFDPVWWEANKERMETALSIARQGPPPPTRP